MANELSASYSKALELHNKILVSAQLAQSNLWDMCAGLKEMRDGKLYKELGYSNFEEYCQTEFNINRTQAHKYISISENKNVYSSKHLGVTKLYLLSTLSESEQEKITAENDVESMTVRQLEAEVKALKADKAKLKKDKDDAAFQLELAQQEMQHLKTENQARQTTIDEQADYIREMENRPIEVAVAEPSDSERRLQETIKALERKNIEEYDALERQYREDEQAVRRQLTQQKEEAVKAVSEEYEEKLRATTEEYKEKLKAASSPSDDKQVFKAYFTAAFDTFNRMLDYARQSPEKPFFREKITNLITSLSTAAENL